MCPSQKFKNLIVLSFLFIFLLPGPTLAGDCCLRTHYPVGGGAPETTCRLKSLYTGSVCPTDRMPAYDYEEINCSSNPICPTPPPPPTPTEETGLCICVKDFAAGELNMQEDTTESQCTTLCTSASFCPTGGTGRTCNFGAGVSGPEEIGALVDEINNMEGFGTNAPTAPPTSALDEEAKSKLQKIPFETIPALVNFYIRGALPFVGIWALIFFVFGGILWLTSAGNPDKIKKAQQMMLWATIGIIAIFASYALVSWIIPAVGG